MQESSAGLEEARLHAQSDMSCVASEACVAVHLLSSPSAQGSPYLQYCTKLWRAQRALLLILAQAAGIEGVPAQEVHCWQLQRAAAESAPVVLEYPHL